MKFYPVYYFTLACPTVERTQEMIDKYVQRAGIRGIQVDMPSHDPYGETDFVKAQMAAALAAHPDYDYYLDAIRAIRERHPQLEIHVVVYPDVVASIGPEKFALFCREIAAFTVRIAGTEFFPEYVGVLEQYGLPISDYISYYMPEEEIERCRRATGVIHMRTRRKTESPNRGLETWAQRIPYVRERGVTGRIFATAEMTCAENLIAARDAGADGVYVGNVLMRLWDDEPALWKLLGEMEATRVE